MDYKESIVGMIPADWHNTSIGEICDVNGGFVQTGPFGSQLHASDYLNYGTPVVMPKNLGNNSINATDIAKIGEEDVTRLAKHKLETGDIIFPRRGDITRYAYITDEYAGWLCGTGCLKIHIGNNQVSTKFLSYYLGHPSVQNWIVGNAVGTTMLNLNTSIIRDLPVALPLLQEQKTIAAVLSAFDDKIELNRQMNTTLEEIARALFKSWFVDFDPVRRNMAGGMAQPYDDLFPNEMVVDGNGRELPKGWQVKPLDEIANYQNGLALQKFPPEGDDYLPVIKIRELRQGFVDDNSNQASPNIKEACILYDGDVVFSWSGSLLVDLWCGGKGALNQHLFKVTSEKYPKWFYYYWTKHHLEEFQIIAAGKATTMGHIQRKHLSSAETAVPSSNLLDAMTQTMEPIVERIIANQLESHTLATLRETLLPRFMSGQLRVPETQKPI